MELVHWVNMWEEKYSKISAVTGSAGWGNFRDRSAPMTCLLWAVKHFLCMYIRQCQLIIYNIYKRSVRTGDLVTPKKVQIFSQFRFHRVPSACCSYSGRHHRHLQTKALAHNRHYRERSWGKRKKKTSTKVCHRVLIWVSKMNQKVEWTSLNYLNTS